MDIRVAILLVVAVLAKSDSANTLAGITPETSWKHYRNKQWGYCVSYPANWLKGDAFEGSGIFVKARVRKHSRLTGEIDVGAFSEAAKDSSQPIPIRLIESFETHLEGLKRFERAQQLEVLEKRPIELLGYSALFTKDRYFDPQDGATWIDEIVLVDSGQTLYTLELECHFEQIARFEPVFKQFVSTFRLNCGEH